MCVATPKLTMDMARKRSVVWGFFRSTDSKSVQCLLCGRYLLRQVQGSTTTMLRHLRVKHPTEVCRRRSGLRAETADSKGRQDVDGEQVCSVVIALEDGDSDSITTVNEPDISTAVDGILGISRGGPAEQTAPAELSDERPVRPTRHKRSLIWRHFERLDGLDAARCRICMKKLQCFEGGVSNLRQHMSKRHPKVFSELVSNGQHPPPLNSSQDSNATDETDETFSVTEHRPVPGAFKVSRVAEGNSHVFSRERELIDALRRTQKEEARTLEHQRELLEKLRVANAREAAAEREDIESLRKAQQEEAKDLSRQREELQKEKAELQKKWEELQQQRQEPVLS